MDQFLGISVSCLVVVISHSFHSELSCYRRSVCLSISLSISLSFTVTPINTATLSSPLRFAWVNAASNQLDVCYQLYILQWCKHAYKDLCWRGDNCLSIFLTGRQLMKPHLLTQAAVSLAPHTHSSAQKLDTATSRPSREASPPSIPLYPAAYELIQLKTPWNVLQ